MRPMHDMLAALAGRSSLHMPGHRGMLPFDACSLAQADTTELPITDDLYAPSGAIKAAETLMAQSAGAGASVFLYGGSTSGIQAMLLTYLVPGDKVILPRNAHLSAVNACIIGGFNPVFAPLTVDEDDYTHVPPCTYIAMMEKHPDAGAVLVTRPDYYGGMVDLVAIAALTRQQGMKLLVDEAHGAHLNWMRGNPAAGAYGADAWVQSAHKTLPALNAAAVMHFRNPEDANLARAHLRLIQTSSPSFAVLKSLDDARAYMDDGGTQKLHALIQRLDAFCAAAGALGYCDKRREDKSRLVLHAPQGGQRLAQALGQKGLDVEFYDRRHIGCIFSLMDKEATFQRMLGALREIKAAPRYFSPFHLGAIPERRMSLRQAYFAPRELVPTRLAKGRTASEAFGLYPPGIPLCVPGETISEETIGLLNPDNGMGVFGIYQDAIPCVKES